MPNSPLQAVLPGKGYMKSETMNILFDKAGSPFTVQDISDSVNKFGRSYNFTVYSVIKRSQCGGSQDVFFKNVAQLMPNFKMTRVGPFKGVKYQNSTFVDPSGIIALCWSKIGHDAIQLSNYLVQQGMTNRNRILVDISSSARKVIVSDLWKMFKKLIPVCMSNASYGLVAASKVLFAIFPEIALPVDNRQWKTLFMTIDYGDVVSSMANEIISWESQTGHKLDACDPSGKSTLPAIYNVMAMKARP